MSTVHTSYGPGQIVATETVRGRTQYKVAGNGFEVWMDEARLGFAPVDHGNSVDLPYNPSPQYTPGPQVDSTIQPIHGIDADQRLHPADSLTFEDASDDESAARGRPGPNPDLFAKSAGFDEFHDRGAPTPHQTGPYGLEDGSPESREYGHPDHAWDEDEYGPHPSSPDFHGIGNDDGYVEQLNHDGTPAEGWREYTDSLKAHEGQGDEFSDGEPPYGPNADTWRSTDAEMNRFGYRTADVLETTVENGKYPFTPELIVNDTDDQYLRDVDLEEDERETTGPDQILHFTGNRHHANPLLVALPAIARGVGMAGASEAMDTVKGEGEKMLADGNPLPLPDIESGGWGDLVMKKGGRPAGLDDRYADIHQADYHRDPVLQFRHDPDAFIQRVGHISFEGSNPRMAEYMDLVEGDSHIREAAWKDVRTKAMRLRREGRVHVKDVETDRIYASVQGDHGTYDVMIKKGGAFGGFGGGNAISNWHCSCEWGKWAFQRRMTYVGRLCSHGYASYMEMQSNHTKGKPRPRRLTQPPKRRKKSSMDYLAADQEAQDWKIRDTGDARGDLEKIRDWADGNQEDDFGSMADRVDDIQEAVQSARDKGVDADQLVASLIRHSAPNKVKNDGDQRAPGIFENMGLGGLFSDVTNDHGTYNPETGRDSPVSSDGQSLPEGVTEDKTPVVERQMATDGGGKGTGTYTNADGRAVDSKGGLVSGSPEDNAAQDGGKDSGGTGIAPPSLAPNATGMSPKPGETGSPYAWGGDGTPDSSGDTGSESGSLGGSVGEGLATTGLGEGAGKGLDTTYTVKQDDTLSGIAETQGGGMDYNNITNADGSAIDNKDLIFPGQEVSLSAAGGSGGDSGPSPWGAEFDAGSGGGLGASAGAGLDTSAADSTSMDSSSTSDSTGIGGDATSWGSGKESARRRYHAAPGDVADAGAESADAPTTGPATGPGIAPVSTDSGADPINALPGVEPSTVDYADTGAGNQSGPIGESLDDGTTNPDATVTDTSGTADPTSTMNSGTGIGGSGFDMSGISDTMSGIGDMVNTGVGIASDVVGGISDVAGAIGGIFSSRQLQADRDWVMAAYPDGTPDHKPFAGSGGHNITEWGQSKDNVKDNYSDDREDVTKVPAKNHLTKGLDDERKHWAGIRRAGSGPERPPVTPQVVRQQRVSRPGRAVEADRHIDDFDPLAPRTASSYDGAESGRDIVAAFQANLGNTALAADARPTGGGYDDFSSSPAFRQAMQRTAGRNYSMAEQAELIREGDRGGASNLDQLDLAGTHYEAMNSVGLW